MELCVLDVFSAQSRPARGAWIETTPTTMPLPSTVCRAPRGARGLKPVILPDETKLKAVAPRAGRVD